MYEYTVVGLHVNDAKDDILIKDKPIYKMSKQLKSESIAALK